MNNYQMFRKIQERDNIIKKHSNDTKEDLIDLVIEKDNIIDNLQSKIDNAIELKHNWQSIKENATIVFDNNSLIEFMNNLEKILKEDK